MIERRDSRIEYLEGKIDRVVNWMDEALDCDVWPDFHKLADILKEERQAIKRKEPK